MLLPLLLLLLLQQLLLLLLYFSIRSLVSINTRRRTPIPPFAHSLIRCSAATTSLHMSASRVVFVTVGSTEFDALIREVDSAACRAELARQGFDEVVVQFGRGAHHPHLGVVDGASPRYSSFAFRDSILPCIAGAALVLTHGGSGTILECLRQRVPFIVVHNDLLMDNHQTELAEALAASGYVVHTDVRNLVATIRDRRWTATTPFPDASQPSAFLPLLAEHLNLAA